MELDRRSCSTPTALKKARRVGLQTESSCFFVRYDQGQGRWSIWALPLTPDPPGSPVKPFPVVQTPIRSDLGQFSPDGRSIVYESSESGRLEIYTAPFPPGQGGNRRFPMAEGLCPNGGRTARRFFTLRTAG